jgi:endonuclease YncB( thermonuclease family)
MKRTFEVAKIYRAIDGDTFDVVFDLGFSITHLTRVRIAGIDAEELNDKDPERAAIAQQQKAEAQEVEGKFCSVIIHRQEKYGRWEADLIIDGEAYRLKTPNKPTELKDHLQT